MFQGTQRLGSDLAFFGEMLALYFQWFGHKKMSGLSLWGFHLKEGLESEQRQACPSDHPRAEEGGTPWRRAAQGTSVGTSREHSLGCLLRQQSPPAAVPRPHRAEVQTCTLGEQFLLTSSRWLPD